MMIIILITIKTILYTTDKTAQNNKINPPYQQADKQINQTKNASIKGSNSSLMILTTDNLDQQLILINTIIS